MEKFVEFSLHEYMDMYPTQHVRTMKGENLEDIEKNSKEYAKLMTKQYSGGPTSFVKVMNKEEARQWIDKNIAEIGNNPDDIDKDWIKTVEGIFHSCYDLNNNQSINS